MKPAMPSPGRPAPRTCCDPVQRPPGGQTRSLPRRYGPAAQHTHGAQEGGRGRRERPGPAVPRRDLSEEAPTQSRGTPITTGLYHTCRVAMSKPPSLSEPCRELGNGTDNRDPAYPAGRGLAMHLLCPKLGHWATRLGHTVKGLRWELPEHLRGPSAWVSVEGRGRRACGWGGDRAAVDTVVKTGFSLSDTAAAGGSGPESDMVSRHLSLW